MLSYIIEKYRPYILKITKRIGRKWKVLKNHYNYIIESYYLCIIVMKNVNKIEIKKERKHINIQIFLEIQIYKFYNLGSFNNKPNH